MNDVKQTSRERIFVFKEHSSEYSRPLIYAFPESKIHTLTTQLGSSNIYVDVNGIRMDASFDEVLELLGERIDVLPFGSKE